MTPPGESLIIPPINPEQHPSALHLQGKCSARFINMFGRKIMNETPTASIPVDRLVEVQNVSGDTLCVTPLGKNGWHARVIRGGQRHRGGSMQILDQDLSELASLKTAVDSFLIGDYRDFQESDMKSQGRRSAFFGIVGTLIMMAAALTFLAFMISIFLRSHQ